MIFDTDEWLTVASFAEKVGRRPSWITHYLHNGTLKTIRLGRQWFIHIDCLKTWPPKSKKLGRKRINYDAGQQSLTHELKKLK